MKLSLLDEILADPSWTLAEVVDIIDFYMQEVPPELKEEVKEDLRHAFS